jgi:hypothetical protein
VKLLNQSLKHANAPGRATDRDNRAKSFNLFLTTTHSSNKSQCRGMEDFELEIPPAKSPLLLPATRHLSRSANRPISDLISNFYISSNATTPSTSTFEDQLLDDIDSLGGTSTDWRGQDLEEDDEEESEDELDDFALEDGHIAGIPSSRANIEVR